MTVTVFQSAAAKRADWVEVCLASVQHWAKRNGFDYRLLGDELFDLVPPALAGKVAHRKPILADLARLRLLSQHCATSGRAALWVDADTFCFDTNWSLSLASHSVFGVESWIQADERGRYRCFNTPHNAWMAFTAESPVLPFLLYTAESMIERVDSAHIAPQMIGPKLIKALHNLAGFNLNPAAGALSPDLIRELGADVACVSSVLDVDRSSYAALTGPAVKAYHRARGALPVFANLCASLIQQDESLLRPLQRLLTEPERRLALMGA